MVARGVPSQPFGTSSFRNTGDNGVRASRTETLKFCLLAFTCSILGSVKTCRTSRAYILYELEHSQCILKKGMPVRKGRLT